MTTKPCANNAFIGHCLTIDAALTRLAASRMNHFGVDAEAARNWDEVGQVERIAQLLEQAADFAEGKS